MKPDDSFSPPLDGLSRGRKLQQILTSLRNSENVQDTHYSKATKETDSFIAAFISVEDILDDDEFDEPHTVGVFIAGWWHMRREPDWWEFSYFELDGERLRELVKQTEEAGASEADDEQSTLIDEDEEGGVEVPTQYACRWARQPEDDAPSLTHFTETHEDGWEYEEFETEIEAPKPLSKAMIGEYLPAKLREQHTSGE